MITAIPLVLKKNTYPCDVAGAQLLALDMTDQVSLISKSSPAALNRYIYYPDHIVRMPGPEPNSSTMSTILRGLTTLFREPLFEGSIRAFLREPLLDARSERQDESIGDFISRRFNPKVADNIVSAVFHGIFAGDIYKLSAQTILGVPHFLEKRHDSITVGMLDNMQEKRRIIPADYLLATWSVGAQRPPGHWDSLRLLMKSASVFTLKDGLAALAHGLAKDFEKNSHKVQVITDAQINSIRREENHDITVSLNSERYDL